MTPATYETAVAVACDRLTVWEQAAWWSDLSWAQVFELAEMSYGPDVRMA